MLAALVQAKAQGITKAALKEAMGLDPDKANAKDEQNFNRDLKRVKRAGWQINSEYFPGKSVEEGQYRYVLKIIDRRLAGEFTQEERSELLRAAQRAGLGQLYEDLGDPKDGTAGDPGLDQLSAIQSAIRHSAMLQFDYADKPRLVHPHDIFFRRTRWYLRATVDGEEAYRNFRVDRITEAAPEAPGSDESPRPELPEPSLDSMKFSIDPKVDVVISTDADHELEVLSVFGVNGYAHLTQRDGRVRMTVVVTNTKAFMTRLIEFGTRVKLEGPPEMREELRSLLRGALSDSGGKG